MELVGRNSAVKKLGSGPRTALNLRGTASRGKSQPPKSDEHQRARTTFQSAVHTHIRLPLSPYVRDSKQDPRPMRISRAICIFTGGRALERLLSDVHFDCNVLIPSAFTHHSFHNFFQFVSRLKNEQQITSYACCFEIAV